MADPAFRLSGRRILITGAGSGIGAATAKLLASEGARVAILDRKLESAGAVARSLHAPAIGCDVSNEADVQEALARAADTLGGLDGVVNSAGISVSKGVQETDLALWQQTIDINLTGTFLVCRAAIGYLTKAERATIVNVSSASALLPSTLAGAAYAASKAGVELLTKVLARELAPRIRANTVCPGFVETPMTRALAPVRDEQFASSIRGTVPLGRTAEPIEIARAILYLTSDESSYVTGISLAVDGGRTSH